MADAKISALTAATTPLAGSEVLPIVQSGTTKKVSVANLTAGRAVDMGTQTVNGKSILGVAAGVGGISNSGPTWNAETVQVGRGNDTSYSWMVNTATIPTDYNYNSGFGVDGSYASNTSTINLKALGVYFGGYKSNLAIWTQSGTTLTNTATFDDVGNLKMNVAGKGVTLVSPNGSVTKTLTIDNSGALVLI